MSQINTITNFLHQTGANYRVYDMGRRVEKLSRQQFQKFEELTLPYPSPHQRHACFAILFWYPQHNDQHMVWFLRFPLDEVGLLQPAARDEFLAQILTTIDANINAENAGETIGNASDESRFAFKPKEEKLANFHAKTTAMLKLPPSRFFEHAIDYLYGKSGYDQWAFVGFQGLADVAARHEEYAALIANALPHLPDTPLDVLCSCLENEAISHPLASALQTQLTQELAKETPSVQATVALLRSVSMTPASAIREACLLSVLQHPIGTDIEVLSAIAGRSWEALANADIRSRYLTALASNSEGQDAFNQLIIDLLFLPNMRAHVMEAFRSPERPEALSVAIGGFFSFLQNAAQQTNE